MLMTEAMKKVVTYLMATGHYDDAGAFRMVDNLVREYVLTTDPLTADAKRFAKLLARVVKEWSKKPPKKRK